MNTPTRLLLVLLVALTLSALWTMTAAADDSLPPPEAPPAEATPPAETGAEPPASQSGAVVPPTFTEPGEAAVADEAGMAAPAATETASLSAYQGDPIWCPLGASPGSLSCSIQYPTLKALRDDVGVGLFPAANGVIWIEGGPDLSASTSQFSGTLDLAWYTWSGYSLTFKGGWDGCPAFPVCLTSIDTTNPSKFSNSISIEDWRANVTLNDVEITGTALVGLGINTTKDISLTRVKASGNSGIGASLWNDGSGTGKVTIASSEFNENGGVYGLEVFSNGLISISNVTADDNLPNGQGARLSNGSSPAAIKPGVTLTGVNSFSGNTGTGLAVYSAGPITANDLTASGNGPIGGGAYLENITDVAKPVTLTGTNIFSDNVGTGLVIQSAGVITLNNVIANSNQSHGASLSNWDATAAQPVRLTGSSQFKYNNYTGLHILSKGLVSLNNLSASGTLTNMGLYVDNCNSTGTDCLNPFDSGITLTGTNVFNDNYTHGLHLISRGAFSLNNITASENALGAGSGHGAILDNCLWVTSACTESGNVTLTGTNIFDHNDDTGLAIATIGAVKANNLTAGRSLTGSGVDITYNYMGAASSISLTGSSTFTGNSRAGLLAASSGAISISNLTATGNGLGGGYPQGVWLQNTGAVGSQPVTLSGTNRISGNASTNLVISSKGAIRINNLTASDSNTGTGASLFTSFSSLSTVTLTGVNVFNNNADYGLYIIARGAVALASITASDNTNYGAYVQNTDSTAAAPANVTLSGSSAFNRNLYSGLYISTYGAISLSNLSASGQTNGSGVEIRNSPSDAMLVRNITLSGVNLFSGNAWSGLDATSYGTITLSNVTAVGNGTAGTSAGAFLSNQVPGTIITTPTGGITLTGTNTFESNTADGLYLQSNGAILLNNLRARENGSTSSHDGAYIWNAGATGKPVTLSGTNVFEANKGNGLSVSSQGLLKLSTVTASDNGLSGAVLNNIYGVASATSPGVTLTGIHAYSDNQQHGLYLQSFGPVAVSTARLYANRNGQGGSSGFGLHIENSSAALPKSIILGGITEANGNLDGGIRLLSLGAITAANVTASGNLDGHGAAFINTGVGAVGGVTLTGTNTFEHNPFGNGLQISSLGAITLNNITANSNGLSSAWSGASLSNVTSLLPNAPGVKLIGTNTFNGNKSEGLSVSTKGPITINNLTANHTVSGPGANLQNASGTGVGVTLTGINNLSENAGDGLYVLADGNITLTKLTADGNGGNGLYADSDNGNFVMTCGSLTDNTGYGGWLDLSLGHTGLVIGVFMAGNDGHQTGAGTMLPPVRNCPLP